MCWRRLFFDLSYFCVNPGSFQGLRHEFAKIPIQDGQVQGAILIDETDLQETLENLILNVTGVSNLDLLNPTVNIENYVFRLIVWIFCFCLNQLFDEWSSIGNFARNYSATIAISQIKGAYQIQKVYV